MPSFCQLKAINILSFLTVLMDSGESGNGDTSTGLQQALEMCACQHLELALACQCVPALAVGL